MGWIFTPLVLLIITIPTYSTASAPFLSHLGVDDPSGDSFPESVHRIELMSGEKFNFSDTQAYTIVNFWATWCVPCRDELKILDNLRNRFFDQGLRIIAVNVGEKREDVLKYKKQYNLSVPMVLDEDRSFHSQFDDSEFFQLPRSLFIRSGGKIEANVSGSLNFGNEDFRRSLQTYLSSQETGFR